MSENKVIIYTTGKANIGDAFVLLGLEYIVKSILKSSDIYIISSPYGSFTYYPHGFVTDLARKLIPRVIREKIIVKAKSSLRAFELLKHIDMKDFNYIVVGGCVLTNNFMKDLSFLLDMSKNDNTEILFIGVGGEYYSNSEINAVVPFLKKLRPKIFVSRDPISFKLYKDYAEYSYNGIDNAFFVSDAFTPPKLKLDYIVYNFDHIKKPRIKNESHLPIINLHNLTKNFPYKWLKEENFFISDYPEDYLTIISNAKFVHTDRIHTSVVSISYGVPFKYYGKNVDYFGKSVRYAIVERVNNASIIDEKENELRFIRSSLDT